MVKPSYVKSAISQIVSEAALTRSLYSASLDDLAMALCFFELQDIEFGPIKLMYAKVEDLSSKLPAQSASVYVISCELEIFQM